MFDRQPVSPAVPAGPLEVQGGILRVHIVGLIEHPVILHIEPHEAPDPQIFRCLQAHLVLRVGVFFVGAYG